MKQVSLYFDKSEINFEVLSLVNAIQAFVNIKKVKINRVNIYFSPLYKEDQIIGSSLDTILNIHAVFDEEAYLSLSLSEKYKYMYIRVLDIISDVLSTKEEERKKIDQIKEELHFLQFKPTFLLEKSNFSPSKSNKAAMSIVYDFGFGRLGLSLISTKNKVYDEIYIKDVFPDPLILSWVFSKSYWVNDDLFEIANIQEEIIYQIDVKNKKVNVVYRPKDSSLEALKGFIKFTDPFLEPSERVKLMNG